MSKSHGSSPGWDLSHNPEKRLVSIDEITKVLYVKTKLNLTNKW